MLQLLLLHALVTIAHRTRHSVLAFSNSAQRSKAVNLITIQAKVRFKNDHTADVIISLGLFEHIIIGKPCRHNFSYWADVYIFRPLSADDVPKISCILSIRHMHHLLSDSYILIYKFNLTFITYTNVLIFRKNSTLGLIINLYIHNILNYIV